MLSSTPVVQKAEESPAPAEQAAAPSAASTEPEPTPAPVQKTVEAPKPKTEPKPQTKPLKSAKPKEVPVTYAVDPMEAFANQTKQQPRKEFDWSQFDDEEAEETSSSNQVKTVQNTEPVMSGFAGELTDKNVEGIQSQSSDNSKNQTVSAATSRSLKKVTNAKLNTNGYSTTQSESTTKTNASGIGKSKISWSNGSSRALIKPASNDIYLSKEAQATIDVSKTVSISFKVLEAGNVIEIKITPESILSEIVRNEIKTQIAQWLFETADYTAVATFECNIIKR